jgi:hypothetical protein
VPIFKIIVEEDLDCFEESVNEHIANGWRLLSDFKIVQEKKGNNATGYIVNVYYQSMLKIDEIIN